MIFGTRVTLLFVAMTMGVATSSSSSPISCGDTIDTDTILSNDVMNCTCSNRASALTVTDGAKLILGGYTVSCATTNNNGVCIDVLGSGSSVESGTVDNCNVGIRLGGDGKHIVKKTLVRNISNNGIQVAGGVGNLVINNNVTDVFRPFAFGIRVGPGGGTTGTKILKNEISAVDFGILVDGGTTDTIISFNKFVGITEDSIVSNTFRSSARPKGLKITKNKIVDSSEEGIILINVDELEVKHNVIDKQGFSGITLTGVTNAKVSKNKITESGINGIRVARSSDDVEISFNDISKSTQDGIIVDSSTNLIINRNKIVDSDDNGIELSNVQTATITRNAIDMSGDNGIEITGSSSGVTISSNFIRDSTDIGICVSSSADADIGRNGIVRSGVARIDENGGC